MNFAQSLPLIWGFLAGIGTGLFYFGGLLLTVRQIPVTKHPYRLVFTSFFLRLGLVLLCFYQLLNGLPIKIQGEFLFMLVLGFLLGRKILICFHEQIFK